MRKPTAGARSGLRPIRFPNMSATRGRALGYVQRFATRVCTCREAQYYARLEEQIESAKFRIGMLFGEGAEDYGFSPVKNEASIEFLGTIAEQIANRNIQSAQVQLTGRIKAKISLTVKGNIKVERSETTKQQLEE